MYRFTSRNADKVVTVLKEFGFHTPKLTPDLFLKEAQIIRMGVPPVRIEIATSISGVDFGACWKARVIAELDGVDVNIISLEDLKRNKKAASRHKDLDDLENLP